MFTNHRLKKLACLLFILVTLYLLFWPVPISPQPWQPPQALGFVQAFAPNHQLAQIERLAIAGETGPEAVVIGPNGNLYLSTHSGWIVEINHQSGKAKTWFNTQGRPLGLAFAANGDLIVADAYQGLLAISPTKQLRVLSTSAAGKPIVYANDVAVASDGVIYFSDSSTKFSAKAVGGTYPASLLDLMEHGGHGRLLKYDPGTGLTTELMNGLNFANGVALDSQQQFVLINETGHYRIHKYWLTGDKAGQSEVIVANLPGFPDNLAAGLDGRYWLGLASPRNPLLDKLADKPWLRKLVQRLPAVVRPKATHYSHVVAIDGNGAVLASLQDPSGAYPITTGVAETKTSLFISSLVADSLARLDNPFFNETNTAQ